MHLAMRCGRQPAAIGLPDFYHDSCGFGLAVRVFSRERVRCGFPRGHLNAVALGRPDGLGLRLQRHGLRIGNAVAEFDRVARVGALRVCVETQDRKSISAHRLEGFLALGALLRRYFVFQRPVLFPSRPKRPAKVNSHREERRARNDDVSWESFVMGLGGRVSKHVRAYRLIFRCGSLHRAIPRLPIDNRNSRPPVACSNVRTPSLATRRNRRGLDPCKSLNRSHRKFAFWFYEALRYFRRGADVDRLAPPLFPDEKGLAA